MKTDFNDDELALDAEIQEGENKGRLAKDLFCKDWQYAKNGLVTLQLLTSKRTMFSFILGIVITVGDKLNERFCG